MTPEILHILTKTDASVLTSMYVKTLVDLNWHFEAVPAFRRCEKNFGSTMGATLDTGGWSALTPQGLAPCKMHQASLGALTFSSADALAVGWSFLILIID